MSENNNNQIIEVEEVLEYYIDAQGTEISNPTKNGRGMIVDGVLFREGENVKITLDTGEFYIGVIDTIATLSPQSKKNIAIVDESKVKHTIKYDSIVEIDFIEEN